jgi:hypothetical protein
VAYSYALLSWAEALRAVAQQHATDVKGDDINDALHAASEEIQNILARHVVKLTDKHWIEYHEQNWYEPSVLRVLHWPIQTDWGSIEIAEDSDRDYGAASLLTSGTDYRIVNEADHTSKIVRLNGDVTQAWESGYEAIRVTIKGGWTVEDIPSPVKRVCREYMARQYHANVNQEHAFQRVDDARGSVTHYGPVMLTKPMRNTLAEYADHNATTCVRFTEEDDS